MIGGGVVTVSHLQTYRQVKDEIPQSLAKGLPVVSFSVKVRNFYMVITWMIPRQRRSSLNQGESLELLLVEKLFLPTDPFPVLKSHLQTKGVKSSESKGRATATAKETPVKKTKSKED